MSLVFVMCIMSGCGNADKVLAEEEVRVLVQEKYEEYVDLYKLVLGGGLTPSIQIIDDVVEKGIESPNYPYFFKVEHESIKTMADLHAAVEKLCTKEFAEAEFYHDIENEPFLYIEDGGELYIGLWDNVFWFVGIEEIELIENAPEKIVVNIKGTNQFDEEEIYLFELKKTGENWYVNNYSALNE